MDQRLIREIIQVDGMSCASCEMKIENALNKLEGIVEVKAIYSNSNVYITYDANLIELGEIIDAIEQLEYTVKNKPGEAGSDDQNENAGERTAIKKDQNSKMPINQLLGIGIIILALYVIIKNTIGFNFIPEVNQSMGYGVLFIIGLLTSLHCVAMCGGINLSQCVSYKYGNSSDNRRNGGSAGVIIGDIGAVSVGSGFGSGAEKAVPSKLARLMPSILYNSGRVVSYTVIGGIVGALGSVVSFSGAAKGIVAILSGLFMVIMGLNMLNIFPWLRKLNPRMPKIFGNKIHNNNGKYGPFVVGLLNGLMPCGPLQSMQLYALGTGSFAAGALSMFMFSIGTVPLMFGLGVLSSVLSGKFTQKMLKVSAVLVIVLGIVMANRGLALSGVNTVFAATSSSPGNIAKIEDGVQVVTTELESGRYTPIIVQKGIPLKWTIRADKSDLNGCNNPVTVPQYGIEKKLVAGDNVIEFTPDSEGNVLYTCWMGMISSNIKVVSDLSAVSKDDTGAASDSGSIVQQDLTIPTDEIAIGEIKDDVQYVSIDVNDSRFSPAVIVMQKGITTKWVINGKELSSHNGKLILPEYRAMIELVEGPNEFEFVPEADFTLQCFTGELNGYVKVVEDINDINIDEIKKEVEAYKPVNPGYGGAGGCNMGGNSSGYGGYDRGSGSSGGGSGGASCH